MWLAVMLAACNGSDDDGTTPTNETGTVVDPIVQDVFVQTIRSPIDILWVLDSSWSDGITSLDEALDSGFEVLLLADPDWRMGMLNADVSQNNSRGLISKVFESWPPPAGAFNVGSGGPPKMREAVYTAFGERLEPNEDFLRAEGELFILVVTDKEDQSANDVINEVDFINFLDELDITKSTRLGVLTTSDAAPAWRSVTNSLSEGGLVFEVGGFKRGLEALMLDALGQQIEFALSEEPNEPPAEVIVVEREHPTAYELEDDYVYDPGKNKIIFNDFIPPPGAQIRITYERLVEDDDPTTGDGTPPPE